MNTKNAKFNFLKNGGEMSELIRENESAPEEKGKIYNSIPPQQIMDDKKMNASDDDDDEWGAVPAFLRRSKLK